MPFDANDPGVVPSPAAATNVLLLPNGTWGSSDLRTMQNTGFTHQVKAVCDTNVNLAVGGLPIIDGYQTVANDRILLIGQTLPAQNGIYLASTSPWARAADMNTSASVKATVVTVFGGGVYGGSLWQTSFQSNATIGTSPMNWYRIIRSDFVDPRYLPSDGSATLISMPTVGLKNRVACVSVGNVDIQTGGFITIDGVGGMNNTFRVLLVGQTDAKENGIYNPQSGAWTRAVDADLEVEIGGGFVTVARGNVWQGTAWQTTFRSFGDTFAATNQWWYQVLNGSSGLIPTVQYCTTLANGNINLATGGLLTIDGRVTVAGDRVLVTNQTLPAENGIYVASAGPWVRAHDARTAILTLAAAIVTVSKGATLAGTQWATAFYATATVGTTAMFWNQLLRADKAALVDGTAAVPALYFASDTNTGLYSDSADCVKFTTGGVWAMTLDALNHMYLGSPNDTLGLAGYRINVQGGQPVNASLMLNLNNSAAINAPRVSFARSMGATNYDRYDIVTTGTILGEMRFHGADGAAQVYAAEIGAFVIGTPAAGDVRGGVRIQTGSGAGVVATRLTIDDVSVTATLPVKLPSFLRTAMPTPSAALTGAMVWCSNATGGAAMATCNGSAWLLAGTQTPV